MDLSLRSRKRSGSNADFSCFGFVEVVVNGTGEPPR